MTEPYQYTYQYTPMWSKINQSIYQYPILVPFILEPRGGMPYLMARQQLRPHAARAHGVRAGTRRAYYCFGAGWWAGEGPAATSHPTRDTLRTHDMMQWMDGWIGHGSRERMEGTRLTLARGPAGPLEYTATTNPAKPPNRTVLCSHQLPAIATMTASALCLPKSFSPYFSITPSIWRFFLSHFKIYAVFSSSSTFNFLSHHITFKTFLHT